jgi:hypothetical protein
MPKNVLYCPHLRFVSSEQLVELLLSESHRSLLRQYQYILEEDPDYLRFHCTSTALKLQFELKLNDLPDLSIASCNGPGEEGCCIIDALEEALRRLPKERRASTAA